MARGSVKITDPTGEPLPGDLEDEKVKAAKTVYTVNYGTYARSIEVDPETLRRAEETIAEAFKQIFNG
jgi:hypothetical protein